MSTLMALTEEGVRDLQRAGLLIPINGKPEQSRDFQLTGLTGKETPRQLYLRALNHLKKIIGEDPTNQRLVYIRDIQISRTSDGKNAAGFNADFYYVAPVQMTGNGEYEI